jgi:hypothetical protein
MSLRRVFSVVPTLVLSAAMFAIGTAAATATSRPAPGHHSLRLVAKPGRIAAARFLAPGDRVERLVELRARGRGRFASVYFVARARRSSRLDADRVQGLRVELRSCPRRWKRRGAVYTCKRSRAVLAWRAFVGRTRLKRLRLAGGQTVHLKLVVTLPRGSAGSLAGQTTSAVYSFRGVRAKRR